MKNTQSATRSVAHMHNAEPSHFDILEAFRHTTPTNDPRKQINGLCMEIDLIKTRVRFISTDGSLLNTVTIEGANALDQFDSFFNFFRACDDTDQNVEPEHVGAYKCNEIGIYQLIITQKSLDALIKDKKYYKGDKDKKAAKAKLEILQDATGYFIGMTSTESVRLTRLSSLQTYLGNRYPNYARVIYNVNRTTVDPTSSIDMDFTLLEQCTKFFKTILNTRKYLPLPINIKDNQTAIMTKVHLNNGIYIEYYIMPCRL